MQIHNRFLTKIFLTVLISLTVLASLISAALPVYADSIFETMHVPGGVATDAASLSEALGGYVLIRDNNEIVLHRDVILDAPLIIEGGTYRLTGAGCLILRGFEEGDLIQLKAGATVELGKARKENENLALIISGGVKSTLGSDKKLELNKYESEISIDPAKVNGALFRVGKDCELVLNKEVELRDNHSVSAGGGVICDGGIFSIADGAIIGCSSSVSGGNVLITNSGEFAIATGTMTGGIALENGGNLAIMSGSAAVGLEGMITSGYALRGGGIYSQGELALSGTMVTGNEAVYGGGIYYDGDNTHCGGNISGNRAEQGGGIYNNTSKLLITALQLDNNTAMSGAGIYNACGMEIEDGLITQNKAEQFGGGIYNAVNAEFTIKQGTIGDNVAEYGGAIFNAGKLIITGSSIATNTGSMGAGIMNEGYFEVFPGFYCSDGNEICLVLGENDSGKMIISGIIKGAKYPVLVPAVKNADGTYSISYDEKTALLVGNAEILVDTANKFTVQRNGFTAYKLTKDGFITVDLIWLLPVVGGVLAVAGIITAVIILRRRKKTVSSQ